MLFSAIVTFMSFNVAVAFTDLEKSQVVLQEYQTLRDMVVKMTPDYQVGGYYHAKEVGDSLLMWLLQSDPTAHEVIRIYRPRGDHSGLNFAITYHRSSEIVEGRIVVRRFIGTEPYGWRNDTVDLQTGEYLGAQGMTEPSMTKEERALLRSYGVRQLP